jgi:hypothetical protein
MKWVHAGSEIATRESLVGDLRAILAPHHLTQAGTSPPR